jgi:hypothetical protein
MVADHPPHDSGWSEATSTITRTIIRHVRVIVASPRRTFPIRLVAAVLDSVPA